MEGNDADNEYHEYQSYVCIHLHHHSFFLQENRSSKMKMKKKS